MADTTDILIIGGGVQAASLAFHLAQRGASVTVLEKQHVAAGATGRSSGLVRMHYDTEVDSRLAWESFQYFRDWKERVGGECGFTRTGFIQIVPIEQEAALRANVLMHQRIGIPALVVTAEDVKRLAPSFTTGDFKVAAYEPESGYAMPSDTANALMAAARRHGARLAQDCAVTGIITAGGRVTGVQTSQGVYSAPVIVNAAGAWAGQVNRMVGLDLPLTTWRHDTMYVRRPAEAALLHPTVIDFPRDVFPPRRRADAGGIGGWQPAGGGPRPGHRAGTARICGAGDRAPVPACPGDGKRQPAQRPRRLRWHHPRPASLAGSSRAGWLLPGLRSQRDGLQDRAGGGEVPGGADPGWGRQRRWIFLPWRRGALRKASR